MSIAYRTQDLEVRDLIPPSLVAIGTHQTMADAAFLLAEHEISAAPVMDEVGCCVGVLTASDFFRYVAARDQDDCSTPPMGGQLPDLDTGLQLCQSERDRVQEWMSSAVPTIAGSEPLLGAAEDMCQAELHHMVVLDDGGHPMGIISSLDILAALVSANSESFARRP